MIIEGIITTENTDGTMHVAPIGPHVNNELTDWTLKPFQTSKTFQNLHRTGAGVFHVSDDSLLMATSVLGITESSCEAWAAEWMARWCPQIMASRASYYVQDCGWILKNSHRYFGLKTGEWNLSDARAIVKCSISQQDTLKPFWGWNRAKHSILELSVLASRKHMIAADEIASELSRHRIVIEKTAGDNELAALELLTLAMSR
jgi:uncharacterized protein